MQWIISHPYIAALLGIVFVAGGVFVVRSQTTTPSEEPPVRWTGPSSFLSDTEGYARNDSENERESIYSAVQSGPPFYYDPSAPALAFEGSAPEFDYEAFISMLTQKDSDSGAPENATTFDAYSFIPNGLISTSAPQETQTSVQQALRIYGNTAGAIIQSFESQLQSSPQILKDQFEDRGNAQKNAALTDLAESLANVGYKMEEMTNVPEEIATTHMGVAQSYQEMGQKLADIAKKTSEQAAVDAILTYSDAVEEYIKNYASLSTLFSLHEVTFSNGEPGSVFVFSGSGF